jgi:hypothetical protein
LFGIESFNFFSSIAEILWNLDCRDDGNLEELSCLGEALSVMDD